MKLTRILLAATAVMALTTTSAFAGGACCPGSKASSAEQAGASCGSKATATQTAHAAGAGGSCGSTTGAKMASGGSCGSATGAKMASAGGCCASKGAAMSAAGSNCPAGMEHCGPANCDWASCEQMNVMYRVSNAKEEIVTADRDMAFAFAKAHKAKVQYYFLDNSYADEAAAKQALFASMNRMVNQMLTMQCVVDGEVIACEMTAAEKAAANKTPTAYRVASRDFTTRAEAEAYLKKLQAAVDAVCVTDAEGKAVKGCATDYAKESGKKKMSFKVANQVASDPVTADVLRAREQLRVVMTTQA